VDFGASDAAMTDEEISQVPDGVVMVPMTAGAVALAYNVPDAPESMRLSRDVYSAIFLGEILNWNDPKIAACNPGVTLPDLPITVVRRAVSSGTTFVFTRHLSAVSTGWDEGPGTGTTVEWPVGVPAKRNSDIADRIRQTPGAIGYLEYGYAKDARLTVAALENRSGEYVTPDLEHARAALGEVVLPENLRGFVSDPQDPNAYPIVSYTWLLCNRKYDDPKVGAALRQLIRHCLTTGQESSAELGFVPLPEDVASTVLKVAESRVGVPEEK
jgi:phosphate transport system substrate-binding protein